MCPRELISELSLVLSNRLAPNLPSLQASVQMYCHQASKIWLPAYQASHPARASKLSSHLSHRSFSASASASNPMEVEVKLRLPDSASHQKLSSLLSPFHLKTHHQENIFFDFPASQLAAQLAALRLRFYDGDARCVVSLKCKPSIVDGISRVSEDEEDIDPSVGRACVAEPRRLGSIDSRILRRVRDELVCEGGDLICLGGFRNVRGVYGWEELSLELDETEYPFGTCYEIECETAEPEEAKKKLEDLLGRNGIPYKYSTASKFAVFRSRKLPE
ncbi:hypothetical protein ACLOJK_035864 [Asimina triloba]